ncbi:hypothetical protein J3P84_10940 [Pseudomonas sp. Z1-29]|uniref:hypothetical protein n=1 Tax=Pseudomonas sp. Z1-29 TaxID=2817410 RepID=UPI003DA89A56
MAQRGYPGIHAGMPTAQCLRSASVVNGAPQIKIKIKIKIKSEAASLQLYPDLTVGASLLAKAVGLLAWMLNVLKPSQQILLEGMLFIQRRR